MGVYRRGRVVWISYVAGEHLIRESTRQTDASVGERLLALRRRELAAGTWKDPRPLARVGESPVPPGVRFQNALPTRVYFITDGEAVKIGSASDVRRRVASIQALHHRELVVLGTAPGGFRLERKLHRELAAYRIRGEWFRRCEAVEAALRRITSDDHSSGSRSAEGHESRRISSGVDGTRTRGVGSG